jgi:hypothetical protein
MIGTKRIFYGEEHVCLHCILFQFFIFNSILSKLCFQIILDFVLLHIWILKWIFV